MKKQFLALAIIITIGASCNVVAMEEEVNPRKRKELELSNLLELGLPNRPEKKEKITQKKEILSWVNAEIVGSGQTTLHPITKIIEKTLYVEPIVAAVYNDDFGLLQKCLYSESPNILVSTANVIEGKEEATLFEVAAAQGSYNSLKYLVTFMQSLEPLVGPCYTVLPLKLQCIYTLNTHAYNNGKASLYEQAAYQKPELELAEKINNLHAIKSQLNHLFKKSYRSALALATQNRHTQTASFLTRINKKNKK